MDGTHFPPKDPAAVLDYQFDWAGAENNTGLTNWLEDGEAIVDHEVTIPAGLTLVSSSIIKDGTSILFWLSGGTDQTDYVITCQVTTSNFRTEVRSATLPVRKL